MKKLSLSLIFSLFVFFAYAEGISNYKELLAFAKAVNKEADISAWKNSKGVVCLKADIDMKKGKKFPSIKSFNGVFDGCGHKLYNWSATTPLFERLESSALVRNLVIDASCSMSIRSVLNEANVHVAYIAHINNGSIRNCANHGVIEFIGEETIKSVYIGAIVARNFHIVADCKNTATVSASFGHTKHNKGLYLHMGGIVGSNVGKSTPKCTVARCENSGNVTYMGDLPSSQIGGIIGESSKGWTKDCVNRGNIVAVGTPFEAKGISPVARVAGITAWALNGIVGCDNYGVISVSGALDAMASGICCFMNASSKITDCINRGKVTTNVTLSSHSAGILSRTSHSVFVSNCYNYGEISARKSVRANYVGGIVSCIVARKDYKRDMVVSDCANFGTISNGSTSKYAATGGVIGFAAGSKKDGKVINVSLQGNLNYGKASGVNPRVGGMFGATNDCFKVDETLQYELAKEVKPLASGENIFGRVVDTEGMPVPDVVVSVGEQSVKSDVNGEFALKCDMAKARFVELTAPAEYATPEQGYRCRVIRGMAAARADFVLKKQ